jgi:hypothetical protein
MGYPPLSTDVDVSQGGRVVGQVEAGGKEGSSEIEIPVNKIDVPFGVKVISIKPTKVQVQVAPKGN